MNPVEQLREDWGKLESRLRAQPDFHPACDTCTDGVCCQEPVFSDYVEVDDILARLTPEQTKDLKHAVLLWYQGAKAFFLHLEQEGIAFPYRLGCVSCPFLKQGRCSIYAFRPIACRSHYALENPQGCLMPARAQQKYACFEQCKPFQAIAVRYVFAVGTLKTDHFGLLIYNRLCDTNEESKAAHGYQVEEKV